MAAEALDNKRDRQHLIRQVLNRNAKVPNFALFLGAGCSANSEIKTAVEMIEEWRQDLYKRDNTQEPLQEWLTRQEWYGADDEYAILFEKMYDQPAQRRVYIEECVKDAHPNWGYVYLTNFLSNKIFDVVFTTNFDDLINEACYLYSSHLRPIVAAHDSAISGIRVTSNRPKIIKLHGDFLFDNIKNTLHELETLEENTKKKLKQFAQEYGLVVVGYGGRDRSVMDTLEILLKSEEYFKQGIYWCIRNGDAPGKRLRSLLRRDRLYLVEIEGFDEFMAELHEVAGVNLPEPIASPFDVARDRARLFVNIPDSLKAHRIISSDVSRVLDAINKGPTRYLPRELQGILLKERGDLDGAIGELKQAISEIKDDTHVAYELADALSQAGRNEELIEFVKKSPLSVSNKTYFLLRGSDNQGIIDLTEDSAEAETKNLAGFMTSRINRAIALKRLGRREDMESELDSLEKLEPLQLPGFGFALSAGIAALRKNKPEMLKYLRVALSQRQLTVQNVRDFPVFEDYQDDRDVREILEQREK